MRNSPRCVFCFISERVNSTRYTEGEARGSWRKVGDDRLEAQNKFLKCRSLEGK